jgi:hypothetical protein
MARRSKGSGWFNVRRDDPLRHAKAALGIKTGRKSYSKKGRLVTSKDMEIFFPLKEGIGAVGEIGGKGLRDFDSAAKAGIHYTKHKYKAKSLVDEIMAYESGELSPKKTVELFSDLIGTGQAWSLQGHYGRTAAAFIREGFITRKGRVTKKGMAVNYGELPMSKEFEGFFKGFLKTHKRRPTHEEVREFITGGKGKALNYCKGSKGKKILKGAAIGAAVGALTYPKSKMVKAFRKEYGRKPSSKELLQVRAGFELGTKIRTGQPLTIKEKSLLAKSGLKVSGRGVKALSYANEDKAAAKGKSVGALTGAVAGTVAGSALGILGSVAFGTTLAAGGAMAGEKAGRALAARRKKKALNYNGQDLADVTIEPTTVTMGGGEQMEKKNGFFTKAGRAIKRGAELTAAGVKKTREYLDEAEVKRIEREKKQLARLRGELEIAKTRKEIDRTRAQLEEERPSPLKGLFS